MYSHKQIITLNLRLRLKYGVCELFKVLSGCPVLEDLSFDVEEFKSKIWVPTLKRLRIYSGNTNYKLEINTPALEYFKFRGGYMGKIVFLTYFTQMLILIMIMHMIRNGKTDGMGNGMKIR